MIAMALSEAAGILSSAWRGEDVRFEGLGTDTRSLEAGNLFVALHGPRFDGHDFLGQARERGAVAALVSRDEAAGMPFVQVEDTRRALGRLAAGWRARFSLPLVALTGSNGKTTVKEMLAAILRNCGETLVTRGNLNNDIGVPLTLARLGGQHRYAVLELGANHPGEIAWLAGLVRPTVALVNNAGPAHLEGFGDIEGVARAKGELFEHAPDDAVCILNADDPWAPLWLRLAGERRVIRFGLEAEDAEIRAEWEGGNGGSDVSLYTPLGEARFHLPLPGRHNVMNALAAAAAAHALGLKPDVSAQGLSSVRPVGGRQEVLPGLNGARLIHDAYNANPASLAVALEFLATQPGERWLVLGDMGELGPASEALHRQIGRQARDAGVSRLYALGPLAARAAEAFGGDGQPFDDIDQLAARLRPELHRGVNLLVKGSRAMRMERLVEALRPHNGEAA